MSTAGISTPFLSTTCSSILIVGAGPAGLTAANLLQLFKQNIYLIDQRPNPSSLSKATGVHRNTLKLFDKLDLTKGKSLIISLLFY